nr:peptidase inhibitor family I36 protein [Streptomyces subrutilus]
MAPVSPAHAADGYDRCPDGYYCMFSGIDGTGDMVMLRGNRPDLAALGMNGRAKSERSGPGLFSSATLPTR